MRFFAAFCILLFHFGKDISSLQSLYFKQLFSPLNFAVSFFFILSGYILYIVHGENGKNLTKFEFYRARFARIYPLYILAWLFVSFPKFKNAYPGFWQDFMGGALFLQSWIPGKALTLNSPAWSLSVEAFFYLLFPFLAPLLRSASILKTGLCCLLFWAGSQFIFSHYVGDWRGASYFPLLHLSSFVAGMYFGRIYVSGIWAPVISKHSNKFFFASLGIWILILDLPAVVSYGHNGLIAPVIGFFVLSLSYVRGTLLNILSNKRLILLGEISYGLYILQIPVRNNWHTTFKKNPGILNDFWNFYGYFIVLIGFSYLMYKYVEQPARRRLTSKH